MRTPWVGAVCTCRVGGEAARNGRRQSPPHRHRRDNMNYRHLEGLDQIIRPRRS
jgi:hypothetical protein